MARKRKRKTIVQNHAQNFETLKKAFLAGNVCIMDCVEKDTKEHVAAICAMTWDGAEYNFTPFAKFFNYNPYDNLIPPTDPTYSQYPG